MKLRDLTYEEAVARHPNEVDAIVKSLRRGKSVHRLCDPRELSWSYGCCVMIKGSGTFVDMISGKVAADVARERALPIEERVQDQVSRTTTALEARRGRWYGGEVVPNPPEVAESARAGLEKEAQERARVAALTPSQREQEIRDALEKLGRSPGFMVMQIPGMKI